MSNRNRIKKLFPKIGMNNKLLNLELERRINETPSWSNTKRGFRIGFPQTRPDHSALQAYKKFLNLNSNNIGDPNLIGKTGTRALEQEVLLASATLFGDSHAVGYISTGGTESNLEAIWMISSYFSIERKYIAIIKTSLTHYSINKAAMILGIKTFDSILSKDYTINIYELCRLIKSLFAKGFKGFIIVGTVGYTATGTQDDIEGISQSISKLKQDLKVKIALHVDAAFGGLVVKFLKPNLHFDLYNSEVLTFTVDFHKMGLCPYPSSLFLCRARITKAIKQHIDYADVDDWFVSGSRSGAAAAACWAVINHLGYEGYKKKALYCLELKNWLIKELKVLFPESEVIKNDLNIIAIRFGEHRLKLPKNIEIKYRIHPIEISGKLWYRIYVMPHENKKNLNFFLHDLSKA